MCVLYAHMRAQRTSDEENSSIGSMCSFILIIKHKFSCTLVLLLLTSGPQL
jgi:hypothetical protein